MFNRLFGAKTSAVQALCFVVNENRIKVHSRKGWRKVLFSKIHHACLNKIKSRKDSGSPSRDSSWRSRAFLLQPPLLSLSLSMANSPTLVRTLVSGRLTPDQILASGGSSPMCRLFLALIGASCGNSALADCATSIDMAIDTQKTVQQK